MTNQTDTIRTLNDAFRRTFTGGRILMTLGVTALPPQMKLLQLQIQSFTARR